MSLSILTMFNGVTLDLLETVGKQTGLIACEYFTGSLSCSREMSLVRSVNVKLCTSIFTMYRVSGRDSYKQRSCSPNVTRNKNHMKLQKYIESELYLERAHNFD